MEDDNPWLFSSDLRIKLVQQAFSTCEGRVPVIIQLKGYSKRDLGVIVSSSFKSCD